VLNVLQFPICNIQRHSNEVSISPQIAIKLPHAFVPNSEIVLGHSVERIFAPGHAETGRASLLASSRCVSVSEVD